MSRTTKNILLFLIVVAVVVGIWYLESQKVTLPFSGSTAPIDLAALSATSTNGTATTSLPHTPDFAQLQKQYSAAKELVSPDGYINTGGKPITIASLIGKKVVLLDFWTYSCINCQRVTPYLNAWYAKYKDLGLEIIGVHAPEFKFETDINNVQAAVTKFGIKYPVVLDSNHFTWDAYGNEYWPEHYLIDINGLVVDRHIGEGDYDTTEHTIQKLLRERAQALGLNITIPTDTVNISETIAANSPETYFGSDRNEYLANGTQGQTGVQTLTRPSDSDIQTNQLNLVGTWNFSGEYATNQSKDARIIYKYDSQHVYLVASSQAGVSITILRDGVPLTTDRGADVDAQGNVTIKQARLYDLVDQSSMQEHTLEIIIHNPGLDAYTFTFG